MKIYIKLFILSIILSIFIIGCESNGTTSDSSGSETGVGGSLARFTISDDYLYTVDPYQMKLFNIANENNPVRYDSLYVGFGIETIYPYGNTLFLGSQTGMYIYDISDPTSPKRMSQYEHVYSCDPVVVNERYAFVTLNSENSWCGRNTNELHVIDIQDPYSPYRIKQYQMDGPQGLGIDEDLLFVCDNGLKVFDASDVTNLKELHHFDIQATDLIPFEDKLMVIGQGGLYQYSYENDTIKLLSKIPVVKEN